MHCAKLRGGMAHRCKHLFMQPSRLGGSFLKTCKADVAPSIITPIYNKTKEDGSTDPVSGQDLHRLGYDQGKVSREGNQIIYRQKGFGDFCLRGSGALGAKRNYPLRHLECHLFELGR